MERPVLPSQLTKAIAPLTAEIADLRARVEKLESYPRAPTAPMPKSAEPDDKPKPKKR